MSSIENETYAVLWSKQQNCFHTDTVEEMLEENQRAFMGNRSSDYIVMAFADSYGAAQEIIKRFDEQRSAAESA